MRMGEEGWVFYYAYNRITGDPIVADEANHILVLFQNGDITSPVSPLNTPEQATAVGNGWHRVLLDASETNAQELILVVTSSTPNAVIEPVFLNLLSNDITGNIIGDIQGNVTGNVNGNVVGNVTGNVGGNVNGNVVGNLEGIVASVTNVTGLNGGVLYNGTTAINGGTTTSFFFTMTGVPLAVFRALMLTNGFGELVTQRRMRVRVAIAGGTSYWRTITSLVDPGGATANITFNWAEPIGGTPTGNPIVLFENGNASLDNKHPFTIG